MPVTYRVNADKLATVGSLRANRLYSLRKVQAPAAVEARTSTAVWKTAARTKLRRKKRQASSGETFIPIISERIVASREDPILRAANSAPVEAPITNAGAATAPLTSPDSAPVRRPASASAARLPQEYPTKPATMIPTSDPSNDTRNPTTPPMPPQIIPTRTALSCASLCSTGAF
jgi:hypothetical protein